jgi:hypothetical protein
MGANRQPTLALKRRHHLPAIPRCLSPLSYTRSLWHEPGMVMTVAQSLLPWIPAFTGVTKNKNCSSVSSKGGDRTIDPARCLTSQDRVNVSTCSPFAA